MGGYIYCKAAQSTDHKRQGAKTFQLVHNAAVYSYSFSFLRNFADGAIPASLPDAAAVADIVQVALPPVPKVPNPQSQRIHQSKPRRFVLL